MRRFQSAERAQKMGLQPGAHLYSPPGGSKTPWTGAPELSEAVSDRWPGQYSAYAKGLVSHIAAVPHGQCCGPVRAYGRLAPSFPGRRIQDGLRTTATMPAKSVLPFFSHMKPPGASRGLPFAAGKNSAPRARRPQPRRNAGQSACAGSKGPVVGEGRVRLRPTRPNRLKQLPVVKRQPPGHPFSWFQSPEEPQKTAFLSRWLLQLPTRREQDALDRRPGTV
jgi:hypothetical protein